MEMRSELINLRRVRLEKEIASLKAQISKIEGTKTHDFISQQNVRKQSNHLRHLLCLNDFRLYQLTSKRRTA